MLNPKSFKRFLWYALRPKKLLSDIKKPYSKKIDEFVSDLIDSEQIESKIDPDYRLPWLHYLNGEEVDYRLVRQCSEYTKYRIKNLHDAEHQKRKDDSDFDLIKSEFSKIKSSYF